MPIVTKKDMYSSLNVPQPRYIFCEFKEDGIFTLDRHYNKDDGKIPLYNLYINLTVDDPSEATFVEEVFGDFYFWKVLSNAAFFREYIEEWREVAEIKRKQKAFKTIMKNAEENWTAAKYIIEEPWKGGPTAAERKRQKAKISKTAEAAFADKQIQEDFERLKEQGLIKQ